MNPPSSYGQCLSRIIQARQMTAPMLAEELRVSEALCARILEDTATPKQLTRFHQRFMRAFDMQISPADIKSLCASLQFTCLGETEWTIRRALFRLIFVPDIQSCCPTRLNVHPESHKSHYHTLGELIGRIQQSLSFELIVVGSAFDSILSAFKFMFKGNFNELDFRVRHYFILENDPARVISQVSATLSYLDSKSYVGLYCTPENEDVCGFIRAHQLMIGRFYDADGVPQTRLFLPPQKDSLSMCCIEGSDALYTFYAKQFAAFEEDMRPIKSAYHQPDSVDALLTLCQRDLFFEQNRLCGFMRLDLCFHALPLSVVMAALDDGRRVGLEPDDPKVLTFKQIHQQRFDNLYGKKESTTFILSPSGMRAFMRTGHMSDHPFAMRDFTPRERLEVLSVFLNAVQNNSNVRVFLLTEDSPAPRFAFSCYLDMGVQISSNDTTYNTALNHSEVFITLPALVQTLTNHCRNVLIPECCHDAQTSVALLRGMMEETAALCAQEESD